MRLRTFIAIGLSITCVVLSCCIVVLAVMPAAWRDRIVGGFPLWAWGPVLVLQFPVIPLGLLTGLRLLWANGIRGPRFGALAGSAVGLWASTVAFGVPWCGLYPNLVGVWIALLITFSMGKEVPDAWLEYDVILLTNIVMWPWVGWSLSRPRAQDRHGS